MRSLPDWHHRSRSATIRNAATPNDRSVTGDLGPEAVLERTCEANMSDPLVGSLLGGRYHVVEKVGSGAFADVYRAKHVAIASLDAAVKVLRAAEDPHDAADQRFAQETWAAGAVRSPFVVQVHDAGVTDQGRPWLAMEYVHGPTLQLVLRAGRPLSEPLVALWMSGILRGLVAIHSCGLIHRDLKPGNILLTWPASDTWPTPKGTDFGIAKVIEEVSNAPRSVQVDPTITGSVVCTPRYAAPEQLLRAPEPASDLYALGLIAIALLTARNAVDEQDAAVLMARHLAPEPILLPERVAQGALASVIERAIQKPLDARYRTTMEMLDALEPIQRTLAANPPNRAELDHLESLFPTGARTHRDVRRQEGGRVTLPNAMPSPLYRPPARMGPSAALDPTDTLEQHRPNDVSQGTHAARAPERASARVKWLAATIAAGLAAVGVVAAMAVASRTPEHTVEARATPADPLEPMPRESVGPTDPPAPPSNANGVTLAAPTPLPTEGSGDRVERDGAAPTTNPPTTNPPTTNPQAHARPTPSAPTRPTAESRPAPRETAEPTRTDRRGAWFRTPGPPR